MSGGIFGFEENIGYAPNFFGKSTTLGSNSVLAVMSNLILGAPIGPLRPYVSAGVGVVRTKVDTPISSRFWVSTEATASFQKGVST
jgi:opacity protein-like surface antigen